MLLVQWGAVVSASLAAAVSDIRWQRIPNQLTFPVFGIGLIWAIWVGGLPGLLDAVSGCLILSAPFVFLFIFAGGGAGDAKLMGALGAWLGIANGLFTVVAVVMAGALWGVGFALAKKQLPTVLNGVRRMIFRLMLLASPHGRSMAACPGPAKEEEMLAIDGFDEDIVEARGHERHAGPPGGGSGLASGGRLGRRARHGVHSRRVFSSRPPPIGRGTARVTPLHGPLAPERGVRDRCTGQRGPPA